MNERAFYLVTLLLVTMGCSAQPIAMDQLSKNRIGEVIYCLNTKFGPIGIAPPKAKADSYLVQYFYGVLTAQEEQPNELQLIIYTQDGNAANLYRVYFDESQKDSIYIGDGATVKKENGQMVPDEISGGLGSLEEMKKVLDVTNKQKPVVIPQSLVVQGKDACVYEG